MREDAAMDKKLEAVSRSVGRFEEGPQAVPAGNVDVSGGGRWRIWQDAGTRIDAPILGNGDLLAAFVSDAPYPQFWFTTNDFWQMESAANYEFFHDNSCAKFDPAVSLGGPRPAGRLVFDIPSLAGSSCCVEQTYADARTRAVYEREGDRLTISSCIAAEENELLVFFESTCDRDLSFSFFFPDEKGKGCETAVDFRGSGREARIQNGMYVGLVGGMPIQIKRAEEGIVSGSREFSDRVDIPSKIGFAGRFVEEGPLPSAGQTPDGQAGTKGDVYRREDGCAVHMKAGRSYCFVLSVRSWAKTSRPLEYALSRTKYMTGASVARLLEDHDSWWRNYWQVSGISLDDPVIEKRYYQSQYMMGSLSRDPDYPPNILGISTFDRQAWNGNYKINYNHQTPYLGLMAAGHFDQSDPHDSPYLDMMEIAGEMSRRILGHEGLLYPLGLGPHGMVSEALLLHMKSPAVHGALNMIMRYELTLDEDYGRKVYPFLRGVAEFWEKDLVEREGRYHVVGDGMHERIQADVDEHGEAEDPVNTLGYLRTFFAFMPRISEHLGLDADKREVWREIGEKLADYPMGRIRDIQDNPTLWKESEADLQDLLAEDERERIVFYDEGRGGKWSFHFPGNIMHIFPGNAVGSRSAPELREAAYNTVLVHDRVEDRLAAYTKEQEPDRFRQQHFYKSGAWNADNLSSLFFPAAVRVGYDPDRIWQEMRDRIQYRGLENGFFKGNPHGIETLSMVPSTLHEMMLQSHEGILRIFPVWPRASHPTASFRGLWAYGAFLVDADMREGEVAEVKLHSRKGGLCRLENPWGEKPFFLDRDCREKKEGGLLEIELHAGETVYLSPADAG